MKYVLRLAIVVFVVAFACAIVWATISEHVAYSSALQALRDSRPPCQHDNDYEFVTRGICIGMSFDEVKDKMPNATDAYIARDVSNPSGLYFSRFHYSYAGTPLAPFSNWEKVYISEEFTVTYDRDRRVEGMKYRVFDRGAQIIDVDLRSKRLSEPLRIPFGRFKPLASIGLSSSGQQSLSRPAPPRPRCSRRSAQSERMALANTSRI
jgi:hypothetical protein